jgi:hypothetical protein
MCSSSNRGEIIYSRSVLIHCIGRDYVSSIRREARQFDSGFSRDEKDLTQNIEVRVNC